jgi:hypothetical protein
MRFNQALLTYVVGQNRTLKTKFLGISALTIWVLITQSLSLVGGQNEKEFCGPTLYFLNFAHLHVICDSYWFMMDAQDPKRLLNGGSELTESNSILQSRPLLPLVAYLFSKIINSLPSLDRDIPYSGVDGFQVQYSVSVYLSYVLLNLIIMVITCNLCISIIRINTNKSLKILVILILITTFNQVTRIYFWLPNTGLLNNFIPIYIVWLIRVRSRFSNDKFLISQSIFLCFSLLSYPMFFLCIPVYFYLAIKYKGKLGVLSTMIALSGWIAWPLIIKIMGGNFLNIETANFNQFIWVKQAITDGNFLETFVEKSAMYILSFPIIPCIFIFIGLMVLKLNSLYKSKKSLTFFVRNYAPEIVSLLSCLAFTFLIGMTAFRFVWVPVLFSIATILSNINDRLVIPKFVFNALIVLIIILTTFQYIGAPPKS